MDLNEQYFLQQIFMMRASGAPTRGARAAYLASAEAVGRRIAMFQRYLGAGAAATWPGLA